MLEPVQIKPVQSALLPCLHNQSTCSLSGSFRVGGSGVGAEGVGVCWALSLCCRLISMFLQLNKVTTPVPQSPVLVQAPYAKIGLVHWALQ
jgi:hypothetical protein